MPVSSARRAPSPPAPDTDAVPARDRTSLVVRLGMLLLLVVGVASVFGETLLGLAGSAQETTRAAAEPPGEGRAATAVNGP